MMSMVSVVSQGRRTALLTGIFSAAVVSMVSRVIDHASSGSSGSYNTPCKVNLVEKLQI